MQFRFLKEDAHTIGAAGRVLFPPLVRSKSRHQHGASSAVGTNTMFEKDIIHVDQVLRAFVFRCTPDSTTLAYWRDRLYILFESQHLNDYQRYWVQDLIHELSEFERRKFALNERQQRLHGINSSTR